MLSLRVSTSRSDKSRRSRSALSRLRHSGFHDEAHIRRPTPKESLDANPNTTYFNNFLSCFRKTGQTGPSSGRPFGHFRLSFAAASARYVVALPRRVRTFGRGSGQHEDTSSDYHPWLLIRMKSASSHF